MISVLDIRINGARSIAGACRNSGMIVLHSTNPVQIPGRRVMKLGENCCSRNDFQQRLARCSGFCLLCCGDSVVVWESTLSGILIEDTTVVSCNISRNFLCQIQSSRQLSSLNAVTFVLHGLKGSYCAILHSKQALVVQVRVKIRVSSTGVKFQVAVQLHIQEVAAFILKLNYIIQARHPLFDADLCVGFNAIILLLSLFEFCICSEISPDCRFCALLNYDAVVERMWNMDVPSPASF